MLHIKKNTGCSLDLLPYNNSLTFHLLSTDSQRLIHIGKNSADSADAKVGSLTYLC